MTSTSRRHLPALVLLAAGLTLLWPVPAQAQAQRRAGSVRAGGPVSGPARPVVAPGPGPTRGAAVARPVGSYPYGGRYGYGYGYGRYGYGYPYYRYGYGYPFYGYPYRYGYPCCYPSVAFGFGYPYSSFAFSIGFGFGYAGYGYPWYPYYGGGPYPYAYGYPYWGGYYDDRTSDLRIDAQPVQAEVYVDGYRAGVVDDFDGTFQRLHLVPGEHELVVYLDGFRSVRERLYLNERSTKTLRFTMDELGPGESQEPRPEPVPRPDADRRDRDPSALPDQPQRPYRVDPRPAEPPPVQEAPSTRFGTLSLRVQPGDAEILLDGERWSTTAGDARIAIKLSPGRHLLEIRKDGYEQFREEIGIRDAATLSINVALKRN